MGILIRNGRLVIKNSKPAFALSNPCAGEPDCTGHTGSPGVAPSIALTIFDADYVGADIDWAGKTWTQSEINDGVTKCQCPNNYILGGPYPYGPFNIHYTERWAAGLSTANSIFILYRDYVVGNGTAPTFLTNIWNKVNIRFQQLGGADRGTYDLKNSTTLSIYANFGYLWTATTNTWNAIQPTLTKQASPNNYRLLDIQFGTVTRSGIQYIWDRGANWT